MHQFPICRFSFGPVMRATLSMLSRLVLLLFPARTLTPSFCRSLATCIRPSRNSSHHATFFPCWRCGSPHKLLIMTVQQLLSQAQDPWTVSRRPPHHSTSPHSDQPSSSDALDVGDVPILPQETSQSVLQPPSTFTGDSNNVVSDPLPSPFGLPGRLLQVLLCLLLLLTILLPTLGISAQALPTQFTQLTTLLLSLVHIVRPVMTRYLEMPLDRFVNILTAMINDGGFNHMGHTVLRLEGQTAWGVSLRINHWDSSQSRRARLRVGVLHHIGPNSYFSRHSIRCLATLVASISGQGPLFHLCRRTMPLRARSTHTQVWHLPVRTLQLA